MNVYEHYWDMDINEVCYRYFKFTFLGCTTAVDMLKALKLSLQPLDLNRILQVLMYGSNVNIKLLRDSKEKLKTSDPSNSVIQILAHVHYIHFVMHLKRQKVTQWELVEFLRVIYNVFKNIPARQVEYNNMKGSNKFPLKFCAVYWFHNFTVAERVEELFVYKYVETI